MACTCGGNGICTVCVLTQLSDAPSTTYYRDPRDRQIVVTKDNSARMGVTFLVEVVDKGEVVDHFVLYGQAALDHTVHTRSWKVKVAA